MHIDAMKNRKRLNLLTNHQSVSSDEDHLAIVYAQYVQRRCEALGLWSESQGHFVVGTHFMVHVYIMYDNETYADV